MRCTASMIGTWLLASGVAAAETNHCELATTGDRRASIAADAPPGAAAGKDKLHAATDYWMTDADLRTALGARADFSSKRSAAERQRQIEAAMKRDPRLLLLTISCVTDEGGVVFTASARSRYADIPMKPGSHAIGVAGAARPGEVTATFQLSPNGKPETYQIKQPGKLVLTRFDRRTLAGTFTFAADSHGTESKHVEVTGRFTYHCTGAACAH